MRQRSILGGLSPGRSAFNPFEELADNQTFLYQFLALRLFGMIIIVPLIEEFFIRGFLMRYVDDPDWDEVPIGVFPLGEAWCRRRFTDSQRI